MSAKNCNQCEKVFTTSSSLSHHKRTHNKLNIVTCEFCGFQFSSKNLTRHKESCKKVVLDSEKSIVKCDTCRMEFDEETKLKQHLEVHTDKLSVVEAMHQYLDKRMRIGNYNVKNLESEAHGKKN